MAYRLILILTLISLTACGFHLRGQHGNAWQGVSMFISKGQTSDDFVQVLTHQLNLAGAKIVATSTPSAMHVHIIASSLEKRILSVDQSGRIGEYELNYIVRYTIKKPSAQEAIEGVLQIQRDLSYDSRRLLGVAEEEALLVREMRQDAVAQLLYRLR